MFISTGQIQNSTWGYASQVIKDTSGVSAPGFYDDYGAYSFWTLAPNGWMYRIPTATNQSNVHALRPGKGNQGQTATIPADNYTAATVTVLTPNGTTRPNIPVSASRERYIGTGVVAPNGLIYFFPKRNRHMVVLNPNSGADATWEVIDLLATPLAQYPSTTPVPEVQLANCSISGHNLTIGSITNGQTIQVGMNLANFTGTTAITEFTIRTGSGLSWQNLSTESTFSVTGFGCTAGFYVMQPATALNPADVDTFFSARLATDGYIYLVGGSTRRLMRMIPRSTPSGTDVFQMGYYNATSDDRHLGKNTGPFGAIPGTSLVYSATVASNTAKQTAPTTAFKFSNSVISPYTVGSETHKRMYLVPTGSNWMYWINPNQFGTADEFGVVTPSGDQTALWLYNLNGAGQGYDSTVTAKSSAIKFGTGTLGLNKKVYMPPRSFQNANLVANNLSKVMVLNPSAVTLSTIGDNIPYNSAMISGTLNSSLLRNGFVVAVHAKGTASGYSVVQIDTNVKLITIVSTPSNNSTTVNLQSVQNVAAGDTVAFSSISNQDYIVQSVAGNAITINAPVTVSTGATVTIMPTNAIYNTDGTFRNFPAGTQLDTQIGSVAYKSLAGTDVSNKGKFIAASINYTYGTEFISVKSFYPGVTNFSANPQDDAKFAFPTNLATLPNSDYNLYNNSL